MVASEVTPFGRLRDLVGVNNPKPGRDAFRGVRVVSGRNGRTKRGSIFLGLCECPLDVLMCELLNELFDFIEACIETQAF